MSRGDQRQANAPRGRETQKRTWKRTPTGEAVTVTQSPSAGPSTRSNATPDGIDLAPERAEALASEGHETDTFQTRLRYLFSTTRQPTGAPWSFNAVARASGGHISVQAVYRLYTKAGANPSLETIRVLAGVFGVEPDYFVRPDALREQRERIEQAYAQLEADPHIAFVSRRMGRMSEADKALLVEFVRRLTDQTEQSEIAPISPHLPASFDEQQLERLSESHEMRQSY